MARRGATATRARRKAVSKGKVSYEESSEESIDGSSSNSEREGTDSEYDPEKSSEEDDQLEDGSEDAEWEAPALAKVDAVRGRTSRRKPVVISSSEEAGGEKSEGDEEEENLPISQVCTRSSRRLASRRQDKAKKDARSSRPSRKGTSSSCKVTSSSARKKKKQTVETSTSEEMEAAEDSETSEGSDDSDVGAPPRRGRKASSSKNGPSKEEDGPQGRTPTGKNLFVVGGEEWSGGDNDGDSEEDDFIVESEDATPEKPKKRKRKAAKESRVEVEEDEVEEDELADLKEEGATQQATKRSSEKKRPRLMRRCSHLSAEKSVGPMPEEDLEDEDVEPRKGGGPSIVLEDDSGGEEEGGVRGGRGRKAVFVQDDDEDEDVVWEGGTPEGARRFVLVRGEGVCGGERTRVEVEGDGRREGVQSERTPKSVTPASVREKLEANRRRQLGLDGEDTECEGEEGSKEDGSGSAESSGSEDESLKDFIVDEAEAQPDEIKEHFKDMREEVEEEGESEEDNEGAGGVRRHEFKIYIQCLLLDIDNPGFARQLKDNEGSRNYFFEPVRRTEEALTYRRSTIVSSFAWQADIKSALDSRPLAEINDSNGEDECEACNRAGHPAPYTLTLEGPAYEAADVWLFNFTNTSQASSYAPSNKRTGGIFTRIGKTTPSARGLLPKKSRKDDTPEKFAVGRNCRTRSMLYHAIQHYKLKLIRRLEQELANTRQSLGQSRVRGRKKKKETEGQKDAVYTLLDKEGFIADLFKNYKSFIALAEVHGATGSWGPDRSEGDLDDRIDMAVEHLQQGGVFGV